MFLNLVSNLYIGKSKLTFVQGEDILPGETLVSMIGEPFKKFSPEEIIQDYPDWVIKGKFNHEDLTFDISQSSNTLYITGIPKNTTGLDIYRLNSSWSSYYEDSYRGYLFQII